MATNDNNALWEKYFRAADDPDFWPEPLYEYADQIDTNPKPWEPDEF